MSYAKSLREKLARLAVELRAIVDAARSDGNRGLTSAEQEKFHAIEADYTATEASIKAAEKVDELENDLRGVDRDRIVALIGGAGGDDGGAGRKAHNDLHEKAFRSYLRNGMEGLSAEERTVMVSKFVSNVNAAAQTSTTTGGGYLIPTGFSGMLEDALKFYGGILGEVDTFETETGNPLPWPTMDDVTNTGRIIGQNVQVTNTALTFGQVTFNAYIFSSDLVLIPLSLLQDSYFDLDKLTARKLGERLGRLINNQLTVGSGGGVAPTGIQPAVVAAGNTVQGATGETTSLIYNDLVDLLHLVDPAYRLRPTAKFMFHDSTLKALRLLKDTAGRPLWQPGLTAGFGQAFPETILDRPYVINNDMPVMAASAYSILYGDLSTYKMRRVAGGTTVMRLVERYADYLQVGYIGFLRADGQLVDAGTHPIAAFQNSAT